MASPSESWTLAGGKKNKPQNPHAVSKGKKKSFSENMPRIEPNRKSLGNMLDCWCCHRRDVNLNLNLNVDGP